MEGRREARKPRHLHRSRIAGTGDPRRFRKLHPHVMKEFDPGEGASIASITDRVRPLPMGMPVTSVHFLGDVAVFIGAEENAALVSAKDEISKVAIHGGAVLCSVTDGKRIVTGGDDGKLV